MQIKDTKKICEEIWHLEDKYKLFDIQINGVKLWELIRLPVLNEITRQREIFGQAHTTKNSLSSKFKALPTFIYNSLTKNPFFSNREVDVIIFDHERKVRVDNKYIDIYTDPIIKKLSSDKYEVIEEDYLKKHWTSRKDSFRNYNDFYFFYTFKDRMLLRVKFTEEEIFKITKLQKIINNHFSVNLDLFNQSKKAIKEFKLKYRYHYNLLKIRKPKEIFLVVSYTRQGLVKAAKDLGILVNEIQHGIISPYHLGYNYPGSKNQEYFPDVLYLFGEYWKEASNFPIKKDRLKVLGFPFLYNNIIKKKKLMEHKKQQILFISQGTIGNKLSTIALETAIAMSDYKIVYKLHPGEFERWKTTYPDLVRANKLENFQVVDSNERDLHTYLAESKFQVGVYSTAIYEGLALKCNTIILKIPGYYYMEELIKQGFVYLVEDSDGLMNVINNSGFSDIDLFNFFGSPNLELYEGLVE
ncbi:sialyltransferase [Gracilibacillus halophilus YIM-C55.5]|uniref:Sialyltransferase n=1 Tax=Gracilibacillus halophilus YIM-C55.5 TaxID=1308866 RepID=N4WCW1_9BACI|nr:hypothetical protein [Gracilibacillus halophilus]ENH98103.1 sialyltransferase [Gracilibacillus halophilus YIM-C55.5]